MGDEMNNRECKTLALPVVFPREANQHDRSAATLKKRTTSCPLCVKVVRKLRNLLIFSLLCGAGNYRNKFLAVSYVVIKFT